MNLPLDNRDHDDWSVKLSIISRSGTEIEIAVAGGFASTFQNCLQRSFQLRPLSRRQTYAGVRAFVKVDVIAALNHWKRNAE